MRERLIQNQIIRVFGTRPDLRIWRANCGVGVGLSVVQDAVARLVGGDVAGALHVLRHGNVVRFGVPGQADLTGILPGGRRLEIEVKSPGGRQSVEQRQFQAMIERFGGLYVLARCVEDVRRALAEAGYLQETT